MPGAEDGEYVIEAEGVVTEAVGNNRFWLELENGHRLVAHATRQTRTNLGQVVEGSPLRVTVSPADLSKGRIR